MQSKSALKGRRTNNFIRLLCLVRLRGLEIWVSSTSFQKSKSGWPQQPPTEKVLKSSMRFHDCTPKILFSKHQNKDEFKNLDDSEVLISDFLGLRTSAASMTSTAPTTSVASRTSTASFHQQINSSWWLDHTLHPKDKFQSIFVEWIIKNSIFHWHLICILSVGGCWGLFWKLVDETQMPKPQMHHNSIKSLNLLPLRASLLCILQYETPCTNFLPQVYLFYF